MIRKIVIVTLLAIQFGVLASTSSAMMPPCPYSVCGKDVR